MNTQNLISGHPYLYVKDEPKEVLYSRIVNLHDGIVAYQFRFRNDKGHPCFTNITQHDVEMFIKDYNS